MKMIHTCLRVLDLERSTKFYSSAFGLTEYARYRFDSFTLAYLRDPHTSFELELTQNHDRKKPYALGDGYGHLALRTDDLESDHEKVKAAGGLVTDIKSLDHEGKLLGKFFFATDPDGYKIEVLAKSGRFEDLD
jgi:lactoylglutathione lyase